MSEPVNAFVDAPIVLVVDDDAGFRLLTSEALMANGFQAVEAANGDEAVAEFERTRPDIVLLDVVMPGMNGFDACKAIRAMDGGAHLPIVMLTSTEDDESVERAYLAGATDFVAKPPNYGILSRRLRYILRTSEYFAHFDRVTGLPNRPLLAESLRRQLALAARTNHMLAVAYVDIDSFRLVNDAVGPHHGDLLLQEVGARLQSAVRASDSVGRAGRATHTGTMPKPAVARVGGDEFVVVLSDLRNAEDAMVAVQRLNESLTSPYWLEQDEIRLSVNMGVSLYPLDGEEWDSLMKNAEAASRHAKGAGAVPQFYTGELNVHQLKHFTIEQHLRRAIGREEFAIYYQPKVDIATEDFVGAEALIRWQSEELGSVSPDDFIPIAERTGMMLELSDWVMDHTCQQLAEWKQNGIDDFTVAVNLSPAQFRPRLPQDIAALLRRYNLPSQALELELTEGMLVADAVSSTKLMHELRELGMALAIDDFGTGYSSLQYLRTFPIQKLKIDKSFVTELTSRRDAAAIVNTIVSLGHNLGLLVTAEGVECQEQLMYLRAYGCDEGQGYLWGKPMPADDFTARLLEGRASAKILPLAG
ncbi:MAG: EAL domain-containing protein [Pseudomonadota bacterium]